MEQFTYSVIYHLCSFKHVGCIDFHKNYRPAWLSLHDNDIMRCRRGIFGGVGGRRFIIIESDLSSCDFSQLSFTSEYSLTGNGSRSSRSRSSRASSNVSSRLWDFRYGRHLVVTYVSLSSRVWKIRGSSWTDVRVNLIISSRAVQCFEHIVSIRSVKSCTLK